MIESQGNKIKLAAIGLLVLGAVFFGVSRHRLDDAYGRHSGDSERSELLDAIATNRALERERAAQERERLAHLESEWVDSKNVYVRKADALRMRMDGKLCGAYSFGSVSRNRAQGALHALESAIDRNDAVRAESALAEAERAVALFEEGCRWQSGMRHATAPHVVSSAEEGKWHPEDGWSWVDPDDDSLAVAKPCRRCDGTGNVRGMVRCDSCGGLGKRPGLLGGQVDCSACKRSGKVRGMVPCSSCNGTGRILAR